MQSVRRGSILLDVQLRDAFYRFTGKKSNISNVEISRWFKTAKVLGKQMDFTHLDVSFFKVKKLGSRTITYKEFLALLDELLVKYMDDTRIDPKDALVDLKEKLSVSYPTITAIETAVVGAVDRLSDTNGYTGRFKHIFNDLKNSGIKHEKYNNVIVIPSNS